MPRQPYLPTFKSHPYTIGALSIKQKPNFCEIIGKCIGIWSFVDSEMGCIFGQLLGNESTASIQVFMTLKRSSSQEESLRTAAQYALNGEVKDVFSIILKMYKSLERERNDLAHGCYGILEDCDDAILWIEAKDNVHYQSDSIVSERRQKYRDDINELLSNKLYVYKMKDLNKIYDSMEEFWWAVYHFSGYMRNPNDPIRANQLELLLGLPSIRKEVDRLHAERASKCL